MSDAPFSCCYVACSVERVYEAMNLIRRSSISVPGVGAFGVLSSVGAYSESTKDARIYFEFAGSKMTSSDLKGYLESMGAKYVVVDATGKGTLESVLECSRSHDYILIKYGNKPMAKVFHCKKTGGTKHAVMAGDFDGVVSAEGKLMVAALKAKLQSKDELVASLRAKIEFLEAKLRSKEDGENTLQLL